MSTVQPVRATVSRWVGDPLFAMTYSYLRPDGTPADRERLAEPIDESLILAGEATSVRWPGTTHGAWDEGIRAADRLSGAADVIVVGAGLAGLAAARTLHSHGTNVTILEGGSDALGRARSSTTPLGEILLGAMWLHGTDGHPLSGPVDACGIPTVDNLWGPTAGLRHAPVFAPTRHWSASQLERARLQLAVGEARLADVEGSVADLADAVLEEIDSDIRDLVRCWIGAEVEGVTAGPLAETSWRHRAEPYELPGADRLLLGTFDAMSNLLVDGLDIRYRHRVERISRHKDRWAVHTPTETFTTAAVVVTCSIAVLAGITFQPPLPEPHRRSLSRIGAGRGAKVFATFDERFWPDAFLVSGETAFTAFCDVSAPGGQPMLCAFAPNRVALQVEAMTDTELRDAVAGALGSLRS